MHGSEGKRKEASVVVPMKEDGDVEWEWRWRATSRFGIYFQGGVKDKYVISMRVRLFLLLLLC